MQYSECEYVCSLLIFQFQYSLELFTTIYFLYSTSTVIFSAPDGVPDMITKSDPADTVKNHIKAEQLTAIAGLHFGRSDYLKAKPAPPGQLKYAEPQEIVELRKAFKLRTVRQCRVASEEDGNAEEDDPEFDSPYDVHLYSRPVERLDINAKKFAQVVGLRKTNAEAASDEEEDLKQIAIDAIAYEQVYALDAGDQTLKRTKEMYERLGGVFARDPLTSGIICGMMGMWDARDVWERQRKNKALDKKILDAVKNDQSTAVRRAHTNAILRNHVNTAAKTTIGVHMPDSQLKIADPTYAEAKHAHGDIEGAYISALGQVMRQRKALKKEESDAVREIKSTYDLAARSRPGGDLHGNTGAKKARRAELK